MFTKSFRLTNLSKQKRVQIWCKTLCNVFVIKISKPTLKYYPETLKLWPKIRRDGENKADDQTQTGSQKADILTMVFS